jgi:hypothetical protein
MTSPSLQNLLLSHQKDIEQISEYFDSLVKEAVERLNNGFSIKRLIKQPRSLEPLPTDMRQLSSYRTRIGTMLEYGLSTVITELLEERYSSLFFFTFASSHEYPDFYFRDVSLRPLLRVEMKAVDAESDEQAARFSTPTIWINDDQDLLLLVAWEWTEIELENGNRGEYPHIFSSLVVPAGDIARERDIRLEITGGKIEGEKTLVFSKRSQQYVSDPGNYGKFWRIVHASRINSPDLHSSIQKFLIFLRSVDEKATRKRF